MPKQHRTSPQGGQANQSQREEQSVEAQPATVTDRPNPDIGIQVGTVVAVGVGAALIETELIPGILLGAAAAFAPSVLRGFGNGIRPLVKGTIRAGCSLAGKTRDMFAEASEQVQDIVAEVKAEKGPAASTESSE